MTLISNSWKWIGKTAHNTIGKVIIPVVINNTHRTRIVVVAGDKVLLTHTWISKGKWNVAGGGIKKSETAEQGAIRELREETGYKLKDGQKLTKLGDDKFVDGRVYYWLHLYYIEVDEFAVKTHWPEIAAIGWFDIDDLPTPLSKDAERAIARYKELRRPGKN